MSAHVHSFIRFCTVAAICAVSCKGYAQLPTTPPAHIVILIEENHAYQQIFGSSSAAHINALAALPNAAVFSNFFAITHPSQPNYLDLFAGADQGLTTDNPPASGTYPYTTDNMGAELIGAGKTFTTYSEGLPSVGFDGVSSGYYVRKHNPCTNWVGSGTNQFPASVNQPLTSFPASTNYSSLPTVSYVVPDDLDDMHDGTDPGTIITGDTWMFNHLDTLRQWCMTNNTLYIVTFDEDDDFHSNQILTIFYGPMVKGGTYSENVNLYNLLRTIEDMYSLGHAGAAATSTPITDCWLTTSAVNNVAGSGIEMTVIPNPASTQVTFKSSQPLSENAMVILTDAVGREAGRYAISGSELTISTATYPSGIYQYRIVNNAVMAQGKLVITQK